jgi:hypothetical protein
MIDQPLPWSGMFDPPKIKPAGARLVDPETVHEEIKEARAARMRRIEGEIMKLMQDGQIRSGEDIATHVGIDMRYLSPLLTHLLLQNLLRRVSGYRRGWILAAAVSAGK